MKTINLIYFITIFLTIAAGCKKSVEFDPGPFAGGDKGDKTIIKFQVRNSAGEPIKDAYIVSYRDLAPLHLRVGEGFTNQEGNLDIEDQSNSKKGYATITAPGYNSIKVNLDIIQRTENAIPVTLANQNVLKVMSYNILVGLNNDAKLRQEFADWVKLYNPDVILFQETSNFTDATFAAFAKTFGHEYAVRTKTSGIPSAITSKTPITDIRKEVKSGILHHGYVTGIVNGVRVYSVHLCPYEVTDTRNTYAIDRKDEIDIIMADAVRYSSAPVVIGGDFNSHNPFDKNSFGAGYRYGERDHAVYNTITANNFSDTYTLLNSSFKATWPVSEVAVNGPNVGARLDCMFVNSYLKNDVVFSDIIQSSKTDKFSDHYPTYVEIKKRN